MSNPGHDPNVSGNQSSTQRPYGLNTAQADSVPGRASSGPWSGYSSSVTTSSSWTMAVPVPPLPAGYGPEQTRSVDLHLSRTWEDSSFTSTGAGMTSYSTAPTSQEQRQCYTERGSGSSNWLPNYSQGNRDMSAFHSSPASGSYPSSGTGLYNTSSEGPSAAESIPGLGNVDHRALPLPTQFSCAQYTSEYAGQILQRLGLEKEDLEHLIAYPESQTTPENLPFILRQIRIEKSKRAQTAKSYPEPQPTASVSAMDRESHSGGARMHQDEISSSILQPSKVIDYGHTGKYTGGLGDDIGRSVGSRSIGSGSASTLLMDGSSHSRETSQQSPMEMPFSALASPRDQESPVTGLGSSYAPVRSSVVAPSGDPTEPMQTQPDQTSQSILKQPNQTPQSILKQPDQTPQSILKQPNQTLRSILKKPTQTSQPTIPFLSLPNENTDVGPVDIGVPKLPVLEKPKPDIPETTKTQRSLPPAHHKPSGVVIWDSLKNQTKTVKQDLKVPEQVEKPQMQDLVPQGVPAAKPFPPPPVVPGDATHPAVRPAVDSSGHRPVVTPPAPPPAPPPPAKSQIPAKAAISKSSKLSDKMHGDIAGVTPKTFPHTCSLCNKECAHMKDWISHTKSSSHQDNCKSAQTHAVTDEGQPGPSSSSERAKRRSRSRSPSCSPRRRHGSEGRRRRDGSRSQSPHRSRRTRRSRSSSPRSVRQTFQRYRSRSRSSERRLPPRRRDDTEYPPRRRDYRPSPPRRREDRRSPPRRKDERRASPRRGGERRSSPKRRDKRRSSSSSSDDDRRSSSKRSDERGSSSKRREETRSSSKRRRQQRSSSSSSSSSSGSPSPRRKSLKRGSSSESSSPRRRESSDAKRLTEKLLDSPALRCLSDSADLRAMVEAVILATIKAKPPAASSPSTSGAADEPPAAQPVKTTPPKSESPAPAKPKAVQSSPPTMLKLAGISDSLSHSDVIAAVEQFGKTKSVLLFRSKQQASLCFEKVEDAEKLRNTKSFEIKGTTVTVVREKAVPSKTPPAAVKEQETSQQLEPCVDAPRTTAAPPSRKLLLPAASAQRVAAVKRLVSKAKHSVTRSKPGRGGRRPTSRTAPAQEDGPGMKQDTGEEPLGQESEVVPEGSDGVGGVSEDSPMVNQNQTPHQESNAPAEGDAESLPPTTTTETTADHPSIPGSTSEPQPSLTEQILIQEVESTVLELETQTGPEQPAGGAAEVGSSETDTEVTDSHPPTPESTSDPPLKPQPSPGASPLAEQVPTSDPTSTAPQHETKPDPDPATVCTEATAAVESSDPAAVTAFSPAGDYLTPGETMASAPNRRNIKTIKPKWIGRSEGLTVVSITNLPPEGSYTEQDVADLLQPFGFQFQSQHIYVIPQIHTALAVMPSLRLSRDLVKAACQGALSLNGVTLHVQVSSLEESTMVPFHFYHYAMSLVKYRPNSKGQGLIYLEDVSPAQTRTLREALTWNGRLKNFLPLLNKVFVELRSDLDADWFGFWYSSLRPPPTYRIYRLLVSNHTSLPPRLSPSDTTAAEMTPPTISAIPPGTSAPFWLPTLTHPFIFPTSCPWFNIPEYVTITGMDDLEEVSRSSAARPAVMLTRLPQSRYRHEDVARLAWRHLPTPSLRSLYYNVAVLPHQQRAFVFFGCWDSCSDFLRRHVKKPFCVGDSQVLVHLVSEDLNPGFSEETMYRSLMKLSNTRVPEPDSLEERLLCLEVFEATQAVIRMVMQEVTSAGTRVLGILPLGNRVCLEMASPDDVTQVLKRFRLPDGTFRVNLCGKPHRIETVKSLKQRLEESGDIVLDDGSSDGGTGPSSSPPPAEPALTSGPHFQPLDKLTVRPSDRPNPESKQPDAVWTDDQTMATKLLPQKISCLSSGVVTSKKFVALQRRVVLLTNLPDYAGGGYTEWEVAQRLAPFGFKCLDEHVHNIYVVHQARMALVLMPSVDAVQSMVRGWTSKGIYFKWKNLRLQVTDLCNAAMSPLQFYKTLMKWMDRETSDNGERTVYIESISPPEAVALGDVLRRLGGVRNYLTLLNKVFIEFEALRDVDRLGAWHSLLRHAHSYRICRLCTLSNQSASLPPELGAVPDGEDLISGAAVPPAVPALPAGSTSPFWLTMTTYPFVFPTSSVCFNVPEFVTVKALSDLEAVGGGGGVPAASTLMLTGLPKSDYRHEDVAKLVRRFLPEPSRRSAYDGVTVLPLQRRAFVFFGGWDACRDAVLEHLSNPFSVRGCKLSVHLVSEDMSPGSSEEAMYRSLMRWSNAHVPEPDGLDERLLSVEVSETSLGVVIGVLKRAASVGRFVSFLPLANRICIEMADAAAAAQTVASHQHEAWSSVKNVETVRTLNRRLQESGGTRAAAESGEHEEPKTTSDPGDVPAAVDQMDSSSQRQLVAELAGVTGGPTVERLVEPEAFSCLQFSAVLSPKFLSTHKRLLMLSDLPHCSGGSWYTEEQLAQVLVPFGFRYHRHNLYVLPQAQLAFAFLPSSRRAQDAVVASVGPGVHFNCTRIRLQVVDWDCETMTPFRFYKFLTKRMTWPSKLESAVFMENVSQSECCALKGALWSIDGDKLLLPLLNKLFIEFDSSRRVDEFAVWHARQETACSYTISRVCFEVATPPERPPPPPLARKCCIPVSKSKPYWLAMTTPPFLFPTLGMTFKFPGILSFKRLENIQQAERPCAASPTVMMTALPEDGYRQRDVARLVWTRLQRRDLPALFYDVVVLPLQRRAFVHFGSWQACSEFMKGHLTTPVCVQGCQLNLCFVTQKTERINTEEALYRSLMKWTNTYVPEPDSLQDRLLCVEVSQVSLRLIQTVVHEVTAVAAVTSFLPLANRICFQMAEPAGVKQVLQKYGSVGGAATSEGWSNVQRMETLESLKGRLAAAKGIEIHLHSEAPPPRPSDQGAEPAPQAGPADAKAEPEVVGPGPEVPASSGADPPPGGPGGTEDDAEDLRPIDAESFKTILTAIQEIRLSRLGKTQSEASTEGWQGQPAARGASPKEEEAEDYQILDSFEDGNPTPEPELDRSPDEGDYQVLDSIGDEDESTTKDRAASGHQPEDGGPSGTQLSEGHADGLDKSDKDQEAETMSKDGGEPGQEEEKVPEPPGQTVQTCPHEDATGQEAFQILDSVGDQTQTDDGRNEPEASGDQGVTTEEELYRVIDSLDEETDRPKKRAKKEEEGATRRSSRRSKTKDSPQDEDRTDKDQSGREGALYQVLDCVEEEEAGTQRGSRRRTSRANKASAKDEDAVSTRSTRGRRAKADWEDASDQKTKKDETPTRRRKTPVRESEEGRRQEEEQEEATYQVLDSVEDVQDDCPARGLRSKRGRPKTNVKATKKQAGGGGAYQVVDSVEETPTDQPETKAGTPGSPGKPGDDTEESAVYVTIDQVGEVEESPPTRARGRAKKRSSQTPVRRSLRGKKDEQKEADSQSDAGPAPGSP